MTHDDLSPADRALWLLGHALRVSMLDRSSSGDTRAASWATYRELCDNVLTPQEAIDVRTATGLIDLSRQWNMEAWEPGEGRAV